VTQNLRDFPDAACRALDLLAVDVDEALLLVAGEAGPRLAGIVAAQIAAMRRPAVTTEDFLQRLGLRAPQAAMMIGSSLGLPTYSRMLAEVLRARSPEGPQEAVRSLLDALRAGDSSSMLEFVDLELRRRLVPDAPDDAQQVTDAMTRALEDVLTSEGWGFATAWRPTALDIELIKLVRGGARPRIANSPERTEGHLFYLRQLGDGWQLVDLDGPDPGLDQLAEAFGRLPED
jgi:hypothetical protein